ncbi:DUF3077 domain-containing protein [Pseudomonas sp. LS1212]|uniref:DUF3077 domain-containing protein n=1 Tax=Pseudomonas sp. LS1212 TaxID=2972478 RepID=UPI00215B9C45|nr:DUF3077 domain-containing protein [Pseudomonas sp. LS1212]UVJ46009.1 DUF3077 domain-containing protein [Pseudomonas sp. LS1212]
MIKIVPDPPAVSDESLASPTGTLNKTALTVFGACDAGHAPLFAVCAGIPAEDALVHASLLLKGAFASAYAACDDGGDRERQGLLWSTLHSVEMAKALIDALLDGAEAEALEPETGSAL